MPAKTRARPRSPRETTAHLKARVRKILARLQADKKTQNGIVHFVLPREIGKVEIATEVPEAAVINAVEELRRLSRAGAVRGR